MPYWLLVRKVTPTLHQTTCGIAESECYFTALMLGDHKFLFRDGIDNPPGQLQSAMIQQVEFIARA
jgi:hypothetical protein